MQFGNIVFIIWRESVEALLVIGILNAWLAQQPVASARRGRMFLWSGVVAGLVAAALLGVVLMYFSEIFSDDVQQIYQTVIVLLAAALIVQMVFWMRHHGRTLKRDIETSLSAASESANWWRVFVLALIAVAREGSETVVFLSGTIEAARHGGEGGAVTAALVGFAFAIGTYGILQAGSKILSWRTFFRITEIMLLLLAGSLIVTGLDDLIGLGIAPSLSGRLWDTSALLSDSGPVGGLVSALTGYRARPNLAEVGILGLYWITIGTVLCRPRPVLKPA
jgi:high-affinity iron transporter